jgi:hypothetical protein
MRKYRGVIDTNVLHAGLYSATGASFQILRHLELAVAAGSADVVTHNVTDFDAASAFGIRVITPAELLGELK